MRARLSLPCGKVFMLDTTKLKKYLGDARFWRDIARLALPIALQNLLSSSFSLVDTLMVGQLGDTPLAAVGMAGQFGWFLSMILFGMTSALTMFVSQYWGAHDIKSIHKVYGIALAIAFGVAGVFTIAGAAFPRGVVWIFNREADVLDVGAQYLLIAAFSYPAIALNYVFMGVLRSTERVKLPLYATLVTTLLNAGLDYAFIFGFGFIPAMGARGAAIATVISAWLSPLITFAVSLIEKNMLIAPIREIFGFDGDFVRVFLRRALPVVANETLWGAGTLVFNIIFANLGSGNYAAVTIMRTFESIAFVFFVGLGSASSVIVGKSVGAGDITAAVRDSRRFAVLVPSFSLLLGAVIIIFRRPIVGVFDLGGTITAETLNTAVWILSIYAAEMAIRNIPYIMICGIFRPGGETKMGMKFDLLFLWCVSLPATLIAAFVLRLPFPAVFATMYIAEDWLKAVFCVRYFLTERWLKPVTEEGVAGLEAYRAARGADRDTGTATR